MKKLLMVITAALALYFLPLIAEASGQKLVNGAGTLPSGAMAFSLDLGLELPNPLLYDLRFDVGLGNRYQLGLGGSFTGFINSLTLFNMINVYKTENDSDFVSIYLNPTLMHMAGIAIDDTPGTGSNYYVFIIQPGAAYEHRFGEERSLGLYFKAGASTVIGGVTGGNISFFALEKNTTMITFSPGIQKFFGKRFALTGEGSFFVPLNNKHSVKWNNGVVQLGGKLGLSWVF